MDKSRENDMKSPRTIEEQIEILKSQNIIIEDYGFAKSILERVSYYRLAAYIFTYKKSHTSSEEISFEEIYSLYLFDKKLRFLILNMLESIEVAFRAHISYLLANQYGPFSYKEAIYFENDQYHKKMLHKFESEIGKRKNLFLAQYKKQYKGDFPIWLLIELTSFGSLSKIYSNLLKEDRNKIANNYYRLKGDFLKSWLYSLSNLRNICAHGGRLYNRIFTVRPKFFKVDKKRDIENDRLFANIYIIGRLSRDDLEWENFLDELLNLIEDHSNLIDLASLGFPDNWYHILKRAGRNY